MCCVMLPSVSLFSEVVSCWWRASRYFLSDVADSQVIPSLLHRHNFAPILGLEREKLMMCRRHRNHSVALRYNIETTMSSLKSLSLLLLPLLVVITSPLRCSSFATPRNNKSPSSSIIAPSCRLSTSTVVWRAAEDEENNGITMEQQQLQQQHQQQQPLSNMNKVKTAALPLTFAAIMTLAAPIIAAPHAANAAGMTLPSSSIASSISKTVGSQEDISSIILLASSTKNNIDNNLNDDEIVIDVLTRETRADEKIAAKDARKARIEKSREAFYDYEARMAEETEDRIEAAEMKAEVDIQIDKKRVQALKEMELKAEEEASAAETPKEKAARLRKVRELARLEKEAERKERKAERAEKIYLAEEKQEKLILQQKEEAALKVRRFP